MTTEQLLPIITAWFENQSHEEFSDHGYVDLSDVHSVVLDARFDLEDLAQAIAGSLEWSPDGILVNGTTD